MKKIIILFALLIAVSLSVNAQTINTLYTRATTDILTISNWSPWANAVDSSNQKYSKPFDISKYDSINCWVKNSTSPARGYADVKTYLLVGFNTSGTSIATYSFATNDSTRVLCDSTVSKNTVLSFYGVGVQTNGATIGKLCLTPYILGAAGTYCNHSNDILNYVFVCHKRQ